MMNIPAAAATDIPAMFMIWFIMATNLFMGMADILNFFIQATPVLHFAVVLLSLIFLIYDRTKKIKKKKNARS